MASATREFGAINERVRAIEARLKDSLAQPDLALLLRAVQEAERSKLHFTLIQQARTVQPPVGSAMHGLLRCHFKCQLQQQELQDSLGMWRAGNAC